MAAAKGIELPRLEVQQVSIPIIGDTPLITHNWSEKTKLEMAAKHQQKAAKGRVAKNPRADFTAAAYWLSDHSDPATDEEIEGGRFAMPAIAFKGAAVSSCTSLAGVKMTLVRQAFHIDEEMVELFGPAPSMREDITRLNGLTPDVRYRPEFWPWGAVLKVKVNLGAMSAEQVIGLFEVAGFGVGVGEWRPGKNGPYGRFHVAKAGEQLPCR